MSKKLILEEQEVNEIELPDYSNFNLVSAIIKEKWDLIDLCKNALGAVQSQEDKDVINDIITDEYEHIGLLEGSLKEIDPDAEHLDVSIED